MDLSALNDFELMKRIKQGEQEAFLELVRRYQHRLFRFFCYLGAPPGESEDMVQEVFLRIFACRANYRPTAKLVTFLYTIARNVWVDWLRKNKKMVALDACSEDRRSLSEGDAFVNEVESQIDIQTALGKLGEKHRLVVVMSIYQQLRYQEIAEILNIPVGTVKSRVHAAFEQLREILSGKQRSLH